MKPMTTNHCLRAAFSGLLLATNVHAVAPPALPAVPLTWTPIADTGAAIAPAKHSGGGFVSTFTGFWPPVISGGGTGFSFPPRIAFKGRMLLPLAVDEAVWSNGDPVNWTSPYGSAVWMVAQESDPVAGQLIGNTGSLPVEALQNTFYGGTLFTTNHNAALPLSVSVYDGGPPLNGLAGNGISGFMDGGRAVTDGNRIAAWARLTASLTGTRFWDVTAPVGFSHSLIQGPIYWPGTGVTPKVRCSPAISVYGAVAHRGRRVTGPFFESNFIGAVPFNPAAFFPAAYQVVRGNDFAQAGERFGTFHPNLMAITGGPNIAPTVAWQMTQMVTDVGAGSLGSPIANSNSLWCRQDSASFAQIARKGDLATDISPRTFASFYALHLADDLASWPAANVFYGVILDNGNRAIYTRSVTTVGVTTTLGTITLIATDDPSGPTTQHLTGIHTSAPLRIGTLFPWFSVDTHGNVLIKATLAAAPAGNAQCLITAQAGAPDFHAMRMRAQSDLTALVTPFSLTARPVANFFITNPEQGPMGRGQGIAWPAVGALIRFTPGGGGGSGIFYGQ